MIKVEDFDYSIQKLIKQQIKIDSAKQNRS